MRRVTDDDPRWRQSAYGYGYNAAGRMDPPPRSLARRSVSLLHGRDLYGFNRIQAWFAGDCSWPIAGSPRIIARPTTRSPAACRRARVRQGQAFGGAEEAPSLTAAARDGDGNMRSGRKNARGAGRTKEWNDKARQKMALMLLDKESPIQAVCGKAARTDLGGGRAVKRAPLPPQRRAFITLLSGTAATWPL